MAPSTDAEVIANLRRELAIQQRYNEDLKMSLQRVNRKWLEEEAGILPTYITEGSFGKISTLPGQSFVYKTTILGDKANWEKLKHEFEIYDEVNNIIRSDTQHLPPNLGQTTFKSPSPHQIFDPFTRTVKLPGMIITPMSSSWDVFDHPTMALDRIPNIPPLVGLAFRSEFFTKHLASTNPTFVNRLFRLYLGRELPHLIQELQPGLRSDLALDVERYRRLSNALNQEGIASLPPLKDVACGMGRVLAQLHYGVGIDGMDVELVLGGDGLHGLQCYILDYNQCQRWLVSRPLDNLGSGKLGIADGEDLSEGGKRLARRIGNCEHYYPKPSQDLYIDFKQGYLQTVIELVDAHRPEKFDAVWEKDAQAISAASMAFLAEYEEVGRETVERKLRTGDRRLD